MAPRSRDRYPSPNSAGVNRHHSPGPNPPHPSTQAHQGTQPAPSVGFSRHNKDDYQEERKKYLTAKYPQHQMRLIRKRLEVEDWVDKQLRVLYNVVRIGRVCSIGGVPARLVCIVRPGGKR